MGNTGNQLIVHFVCVRVCVDHSLSLQRELSDQSDHGTLLRLCRCLGGRWQRTVYDYVQRRRTACAQVRGGTSERAAGAFQHVLRDRTAAARCGNYSLCGTIPDAKREFPCADKHVPRYCDLHNNRPISYCK